MLNPFLIFRGRILNVWPWGYKQHETICCPTMELQEYVQDNYLEETRASLPLYKRFQIRADAKKLEIASQMKVPIEDVTFVGVHNRYALPLIKFHATRSFNKRK